MSKEELTIGERWRGSKLGKGVKKVITSDTTKRIRDKGLSLLGEDKEHVKRFAQYLTGGTVGNKAITDLPEGVRRDVIKSHRRGNYPNRKEFLTKKFTPEIKKNQDAIYEQLGAGQISEAEKDKQLKELFLDKNPSYNPRDTLLSTYGNSTKPRTSGSIGHAQFKQGEDGDYTLTDTWKVDDPNSFKNDPYYKDKRDLLIYKPWESKEHPDLREGGQVAARAYDVAKFLGINKNLEYDVKFKGSNVDKKKKKK